MHTKSQTTEGGASRNYVESACNLAKPPVQPKSAEKSRDEVASISDEVNGECSKAAILGNERGSLLSNLALYSNEFIKTLEKDISAIQSRVEDGKIQSHVSLISGGIDSLKKFVLSHEAFFQNRDASVKEKRAVLHDMANHLSFLGYIELISRRLSMLSPKNNDEKLLEKIRTIGRVFKKYFDDVRECVIKEMFGSDVVPPDLKNGESMLTKEARIRFPKGSIFVVLDDEKSIRGVCESTISLSEGKPFTCYNKESLELVINEVRKTLQGIADPSEKFVTFLIDHNLRGTEYGYQFLELIAKAFPNALIVIHSHDYKNLLDSVNSPYSRYSVQFVEKLDWAKIQDLVWAKYTANNSESFASGQKRKNV